MVLTNPQHPEFIVAFRWRAVYKYYYFIIRGGGDIYDCETEYARSRMEQKLGVITVEEFLEKILAN